MNKYLRHFTAVGDKQPGQWEELEEELHVGSEELAPATGPVKLTLRDALKRLFTSDRFQIVVVILVILDALFVLVELLIDLDLLGKSETEHGGDTEHGDTEDIAHMAAEVFHYLSLAVLTFFIVELMAKLFTFRLEFFQHYFEVFDGLIVIISFALDIASIAHEDAFDGTGLLILLRLWRVARIINGVLVSVKNRSDQKVHKLKESYDRLVKKVNELQESQDKLEQENSKLHDLLKQHGIDVKV